MKKDNLNIQQLMDIFIGLAQATRCCRQDTAFCGDVTFHQYVILDAVARHEDLRISDLHGLLGVEKSTTTRLVNPLISKGFLSKKPSSSDSRVLQLALTPSGAAKHREVTGCLTDFFQNILGQLPREDQLPILQAVQTFIDAIKNASGTCSCCRTSSEGLCKTIKTHQTR